jgi:hypothetical protein
MSNPAVANAMRSLLVCTLVLAGFTMPAVRAQNIQLAANSDQGQLYSLHRVDSAASLAGGTEPLSSCGDALSIALQQGTPEFPCWANIRTVDRWNSASFGFGASPVGNRTRVSPHDVPSSFTFTAGGLSAFSLPGAGQGKAYGGLGAMSGLVEQRRWQLMAEDAGGLADFQLSGGHFVGLNLAAVRVTGEITPRLTWQGSATNTYGTDAARQVAPIDYRMVGEADIPAPDTPAYGLHGGLMTEGEEGIKLRYEESRRSAWDFSGTHSYTKYNADRFLVHSGRGRIEYLHRVAEGAAFGFYGSGEHQTQPLGCTLGGAGMRVLTSWGSHASLNLSGGVNGANSDCGKRVAFTGNAAFYVRLTSKTDFYAMANHDLGDGVLEHTIFLSTSGAGLRHAFSDSVGVSASLNELYGVDPRSKQTYHGSFVDGSFRCRLWMGLSEEIELRRYSFSGFSQEAARTVAVFTLWWSPPRGPEARRTVVR